MSPEYPQILPCTPQLFPAIRRPSGCMAALRNVGRSKTACRAAGGGGGAVDSAGGFLEIGLGVHSLLTTWLCGQRRRSWWPSPCLIIPLLAFSCGNDCPMTDACPQGAADSSKRR